MFTHETNLNDPEQVQSALGAVAQKIAPVWPLESFVAVNPYLGMIGDDFGTVAHRLRRVAGAKMTMPVGFYVEALDRGDLTTDDVATALDAAGQNQNADVFIRVARDLARAETTPNASVPTVADVGRSVTGIDWVRFVTDRVSAWASAYFDQGQAEWHPSRTEPTLYAAWRAEAELDRTPEIMGVSGFRKTVAAFPAEPIAAATEALARLGVPAAGLDLYLHRLAMRVGGWAAYASRIVWDRGLYEGAEDDTLIQFLCVLLTWEVALLEGLKKGGVVASWDRAKERLAASELPPEADLDACLVLQDAYERAAQRKLESQFNDRAPVRRLDPKDTRPRAQAVFCIDVRSEVYRRHLEAADASIETLGFAGFFAFPVEFVPLAHEKGGTQCPVLLTPAAKIEEGIADAEAEKKAIEGRRLSHEVKRAWQSFKMGAVSCFSFVGPIGLAYLPKLFTDGFGWTRPVPHPAEEGLGPDAAKAKDARLMPGTRGGQATGLTLEQRVELAAGALGAMSLTSGFARLVLITGHGSTTVNNPHATGLDCGACGGRTGEANARVAAHTLNDAEVREQLAERGIEIPEDTIFLACQHDTTTDEVTIFNRDAVPSSHAKDLAELDAALEQAGRSCRAERAGRLGVQEGEAVDRAVLARSRDWAQVRPEWGLAGCSAFIVAPRHRTQSLSFDGRSFLHSYEWRQDEGFSVLELIMTAPMVVASWISLQYYASTVDNELFGCGNKTLHNVVGMVGVLEGNGGDLRVGLPWQSVHDGEMLQHDPLRLNVMIEAPTEAMNGIIEKHEMVRHLLDNGWLHLYAIDDEGRLAQKYDGGLQWKPVKTRRTEVAPQAEPAPALKPAVG
jgi:hypothetical protein